MKLARHSQNPFLTPPRKGTKTAEAQSRVPLLGGVSGGFIRRSESAFTMVEIAISLAIIGFALVAIIGVLPVGLDVQKDNRQETIINQDAGYFMDAIRSGARGLDDLTNYVLAIVITRTNNSGGSTTSYLNSSPLPAFTLTLPNQIIYLTNGANIVGLLSVPKYETTGGVSWTNRVAAYVRALSGAASEKSPQSDTNIQDLAFTYRVISEIAPLAGHDTNSPYGKNLQANLNEVRLLFSWPLLPNGSPGNGREVYRSLVSGSRTNEPLSSPRWFFQPTTFVNVP